ncbi:MAG: ribbon-helix-helix domain-containing protein [Roseburia sp.]|nr:ribbon-helix-helix domain-containing protein [Roseburia sp.]
MSRDEDKLIIKPKKFKGNDGYKTFSIRIKEELVDSIDTISAKTEHSRNELIGIFLEYAIRHCEIED